MDHAAIAHIPTHGEEQIALQLSGRPRPVRPERGKERLDPLQRRTVIDLNLSIDFLRRQTLADLFDGDIQGLSVSLDDTANVEYGRRFRARQIGGGIHLKRHIRTADRGADTRDASGIAAQHVILELMDHPAIAQRGGEIFQSFVTL
ncbi:hypothetical protein [Breoghania sp.]|uniref:hypothetical protein n=1 Tax=Breoghania sp. TaxID=2065378 RepID=UPI00261A0275|nr:hypothetical protein [Breoghania sp.]MDJ0932261.1 hypothetical protein [Breoghania sp.]